MPFFPLIGIILLTLNFYLVFLYQIFSKLSAFEITEDFQISLGFHSLPYFVVHGNFVEFVLLLLIFNRNYCLKFLKITLNFCSPLQPKIKISFANKLAADVM